MNGNYIFFCSLSICRNTKRLCLALGCKSQVNRSVFFYHPLQTGSTALFFASQQGHHDVVKLLFEFGASTEFQTKVCCGDVFHSFQILLRHQNAPRGEIKAMSKISCWAIPLFKCIIYTANSGDFQIFIFLFSSWILFNSCHCCVPSHLWWQDGGTALTVASQYGQSKVVDILLKNGANVHDQLNVRPFASTSAACS